MASRKTANARARPVPETMKAAVIDRFGPPSVLRARRMRVPRPGPGEVLVEIHAAGVGVWCTQIRDGSWRPFGRARFPLVLGTDGAGVVVARGKRVRRLAIGDRVWAYHSANRKGGFYAEYVAIPAKRAGRVPRRLDLLQAGAGAVTGLTALQGVAALELRRGETVLVFGASGAVGTLAVQFATLRRARVLATASGRAAIALVRRLGAEVVIDARRRDAVERLRSLAPGGLDAVLAFAGGDELERCLNLVRSGGRIVYPNGVEPEPRRRPRVRRLSYDAEGGPREFARLAQAAEAVRLRVPIAAAYPLSQAARAHARIERGHVAGRTVLRVARR
jgi:NADPH:quinone reductase-like Zn-dependent oxidoreductase